MGPTNAAWPPRSASIFAWVRLSVYAATNVGPNRTFSTIVMFFDQITVLPPCPHLIACFQWQRANRSQGGPSLRQNRVCWGEKLRYCLRDFCLCLPKESAACCRIRTKMGPAYGRLTSAKIWNRPKPVSCVDTCGSEPHLLQKFRRPLFSACRTHARHESIEEKQSGQS